MPSTRRSSERLRKQLVRELRGKGVIRSERVEAAFLSVPREHFLPAVAADRGLEAVYRDEAIVTKRDARGMPLSSSSQPALMAEMLELVDVHPGDRILEIGAGTGYNAALLAHLVGPRGRVTSLDINRDLARQARRSLREVGVRATVAVGDGRQGHAAGAPYDRILVTACADEIAPAWPDQLADGGRLQLPLRLDPDGAAIQLIPVLAREGSRLRSVGLSWGSFMPLHDGDGGWRPPASAVTASRSTNGEHTSLVSISGAGLRQLSAAGARRLLASLLTQSAPPRRQGLTDLSSRRPPMLLLYLLLSIPPARRVSLNGDGRLGVGVIHPASDSVAVVSVRTPWRAGKHERYGRARWRLDNYGSEQPATELERLLDGWKTMQRRGKTTLQITGAQRDGAAPRLSFAWSADDN